MSNPWRGVRDLCAYNFGLFSLAHLQLRHVERSLDSAARSPVKLQTAQTSSYVIRAHLSLAACPNAAPIARSGFPACLADVIVQVGHTCSALGFHENLPWARSFATSEILYISLFFSILCVKSVFTSTPLGKSTI